MNTFSFNSEPNYLKARILAPFAPRYRNRLLLRKLPPELRLIAFSTLVSNDHRIVLVKNPKAGCTSAAHMLYQFYNNSTFRGDIHQDHPSLIQGITRVREVHAALQNPDTFKFTTVRNPIDRTLSAYKDFFANKTNPESRRHANAIAHFGFRDTASNSDNFDAYLAFLEAYLSIDTLRADEHFRPQTINTSIDHIKYDAICRVENLQYDICTALETAGVSGANIENIPAVARNQSPSNSFRPNSEQTKRICQLYEQDFETFGYEH
ncbi:MAG: sulfotransferase family 2 domain-containing protein [Paracoccaceae bacterium]